MPADSQTWREKSTRVLRLLLAVVLIANCSLVLASCTQKLNTLQEIQERGSLIIGLDPSYPPFEALAVDGELFGLDVDLGRALAEQLGVEAHFVLLGYDGLYPALEVRQVDVLISALVVEPGRMEDVAYSSSYFDAGLVLVTPTNQAEELETMRDLTGRAVAVEYATQGEVEARRWARRLGNLNVRPMTTAEDALGAVLAANNRGKTADAALVDHISARLYLRTHYGLTIASEPVTSEPYAVAVRAADSQLLDAINAALQSLATEGDLAALLARWL